MKTYTLTIEADTKALAKSLATTFKAGDILLLEGDLGTGKSTFARHLIWALGSREKHIPSPTYTIYQTYEDTTPPVIHTDAYRLNGPEDFIALDLEPLRPTHVFIIEWPENINWHSNMTNPHGQVYTLQLNIKDNTRAATFS